MFTGTEEEIIRVYFGQAGSHTLARIHTNTHTACAEIHLHIHTFTGLRGLPHIVQVVDAGNHFD